MDEILITWLEAYTGVTSITVNTKFSDLKFDLFDEAQTVKFIKDSFNLNANKYEIWPETLKDLLDGISICPRLHETT
jgi:predicted HD phosphohydrolase